MRISLRVAGVVQGIGFRPFVQHRATALGLSGWIRNARSGVEIEVSGSDESITTFCDVIKLEIPPPGKISSIIRNELPEIEPLQPSFRILPSDDAATTRALLPPDLAICADCLVDIRSQTNRRHGYALTCCARCGPRYSIVENLPYDRARTTMRIFVPCPDCRREYEDPADRRFHAEPIACPQCGPQIALLSTSGISLASGRAAIHLAAMRLRAGEIIALRGLGGFQLVCDATNDTVVSTLRRRKNRPDKPFAVMFGDLESLARHARISEIEREALTAASAPIVLLRQKDSGTLSENVAPNCPLIGAMLPTSGMHQLLADAFGAPFICTSGNASGEPLCIDTSVALKRLYSIADVFLGHDRPILRPIDDSVVREGPAGIRMLRRARGFAPLPVFQLDDDRCILGVGAFLKNTVSLLVHGEVITSQHIGDLDDVESVDLLETTVRDMVRFFDVQPEIIACDLHPDFPSTRLAERLAKEWNARLFPVQHHYAHAAAVMAEKGITDAMALVWDGYGFGEDAQAWGGETFRIHSGTFERIGHLQTFPLVGGEIAARAPWRCAVGLLAATLDKDEALEMSRRCFPNCPVDMVWTAMERGISVPQTSSVGRLFDAIAALLGMHANHITFEGQAAMQLEWCAGKNHSELPTPYPIALHEGALWIADFKPMVQELSTDLRNEIPHSTIAARFISGLVDLGVRSAKRAGLSNVVLAGGCFQNDLLTRALVRRLDEAGFVPFLSENVPTNDGGISAGQVAFASQMTKTAEEKNVSRRAW